MNTSPVTPDGGDFVVDLTADDGHEPIAAQPMGPTGPSVEQRQQRVDAFAKIMWNYRRTEKRPRPDNDDGDDVVDLTTI